jgi:alpha-L-fucosidase 2
MKRTILAISTILMIVIILMNLGCRQKKAGMDYISKYKGVFTTPPSVVPTLFATDGPIAGNGDVGIVYTGNPESQRFYFSKNDFWRSKPGYPDGAINLVGGLDILADSLEGASYYVEQHIDHATINALFQRNDFQYKLNSWVSATDNLVVIELESTSKPVKISLNLWPKAGNGSVIDSGRVDNVYWVSRKFESSDLEWPTSITVAMNISGAPDKTFLLNPSEKIYISISFCTNHDREDHFETAIRKAKSITLSSIKQLRSDHENWWAGFWAKSRVEIGDTIIERGYYASQYLLACCSRNVKFPPGLWGNSLTEDAGFYNWTGDYHLNYNHQAPWWGVYSSNQIELSEPYDAPILDYMENGRKHAKELLDCRGVYYPVGIGPKGFCASRFPLTEEKMMKYYKTPDTMIEGGYMFCGQKSHAVFCTANMFMRFYHTYDSAYALKVYPFLLEVANFWEDYLKYENGRYVVYDDNFFEVGPWQGKDYEKNYGDINPSLTLGMLKMFFRNIIDISTFLNRDIQRHEKWQHILENLSKIPTIEYNGIIRIPGAEGGTGSGTDYTKGYSTGFIGYWGMHGLIWPSDAFGLRRDPDFVKILRDEISTWSDDIWMNAMINTIFTAAVRCGVSPEFILAKLSERITKTSYPNMYMPYGGGGTETFSGVPSCINEMLLQGYEGMIRVFPAWPENKDAKFENLRTYGAFLVSSEIKDGKIKFLYVVSEKARPCIIENPWGESEVVLKRNGKKGEALGGGILRFDTKKDEQIMINPKTI